jgi:hypothetical protein
MKGDICQLLPLTFSPSFFERFDGHSGFCLVGWLLVHQKMTNRVLRLPFKIMQPLLSEEQKEELP